MRKGKDPDPDPDPYLWVWRMDPDLGGPKTSGSAPDGFDKDSECRFFVQKFLQGF